MLTMSRGHDIIMMAKEVLIKYLIQDEGYKFGGYNIKDKKKL